MINLITKCPSCGKETKLMVTEQQYKDLNDGKKLIQNIFPDWSPEDRELLITGICSNCWDKMFEK